MKRSKLFVQPPSFFFFIVLMSAIVSGSLYQVPGPFLAAGGGVLAAVTIFLWLRCKPGLIVLTGIFLFGLGFCQIQNICFPDHGPDHIIHHISAGKHTITGTIEGFGRHYLHKAKYIVNCRELVTKQGLKRKVSGRITLSVYNRGPLLKIGDRICFKSALKPIRNFSNPGGFDYVRYMKFQGIWASAYANPGNIKILSKETDHGLAISVLRGIETFRSRFNRFVLEGDDKYKSSRQILGTLLTGKKENISQETRDLFSKAGLSHLLAISGLHLSIVGTLFFIIFYHFFSFFKAAAVQGRSKKGALICSIFPILLYAVFSGFSPSTQRALIMTFVFLIFFVMEKENDLFSSLCLAGISILLLKPASLFSISFQLSFAAVAFIITGLKCIRLPVSKLDNKYLRTFVLSFGVTVFASIGTMPIVANYFHIVSFVQFVNNLIAVPVIGIFVLPAGLISAGLHGVFPELSKCLIDLSSSGIDMLILLSQKSTALKWAWVRIPSVSLIDVILFYAGCIFLFWYGRNRGRRLCAKYGMAFVCFVLLALHHLFYAGCLTATDADLKITILDVGQGNSAFIRTPAKKSILIDGGGFPGSASGFDTGRSIVAPFLWDRHVTHIDYVILTHPENDHLKGLIYILDNFDVQNFVKNPDENRSRSYQKLMTICQKKKINLIYPAPDQDALIVGDIKLQFYPPFGKSQDDLNNNSIVMKLEYKDFQMLFPGDIRNRRERFLSNKYPNRLAADILLSPHHGSMTSSSKFFLEKVNPDRIIISCGWQNRYKFPHPEVLERYRMLGIGILRTDNQGAVQILSDGRTYSIKTAMGSSRTFTTVCRDKK